MERSRKDRFVHGGDTYGLGEVLDFSASLNPLGMPAQVVRAVQSNAAAFDVYPDPLARDLTARLSEREDVPAQRIVATAGATDAFTRIALAFKPHTALVCSPCYAGYEQALSLAGTRIMRHALLMRENFDVSERILDEIRPEVDFVFLCTPNNPTGRVLPRALLCDIINKAERWGTFVVLDECFVEFTREHSAVSLLERHPKLLVVKAFTKTYAMAGLRLGYALCGSDEAAQRLQAVGAPWSVSAPAQVAGLAALDVPGYLDLTRDYVDEERLYLEHALRALRMLVVPSEANFILFEASADLGEALRRRGIIVRSCGNFPGLDGTWYRIAVRTHAENERLVQALQEASG